MGDEIMVQARINELMKEKGITQARLAEGTDLPPSTVSRWVNNYIRSYDQSVIEKFMVYFDVTIDKLFKVTYKK